MISNISSNLSSLKLDNLPPTQLSELTPLVPTLRLILGAKASLLETLIEKGIFDEDWVVTQNYQNFRFPFLNTEERRIVITELKKTISIKLTNETIEISLWEILTHFRTNSYAYSLHGLHLIGEYVDDLLFHQSRYAQRIFKMLNLEDFYTQPTPREPPFLVLRQFLRVRPLDLNDEYDPYPQKHHFQEIQNIVFNAISSKSNEVLTYGFKDLKIVDDESNLFLLIRFLNSNCNLNFVSSIEIDSHFTCDSLHFVLDGLLDENAAFLIPRCYGVSLQAFFEYRLGILRASQSFTLNGENWFGLIAKRVLLGQMPHDLSLENQFFLNFNGAIGEKTEGLLEGLKNWFKQYSYDPQTQFFFLLDVYLLLVERPHLAKEILLSEMEKLDLKGETALIRELLCQEKIPPHLVVDFLILTAFLMSMRKRSDQGISIEYLQEKDVLITQLTLHQHTLHLKGDILAAFTRFTEQVECWKGGEKVFQTLFFLLSPLHLPSTVFEQKECSQLGISLNSLEITAIALMKSPSPLLKFLGIFCHSGLSCISQGVCETYAFELLSPLTLSVSREVLVTELSKTVGPIPETEKEWVSLLIGKGSYELAFELLKPLVLQEKKIEWPLAILKQLIHKTPSYATRLYLFLKKEGFLNQPIPALLECTLFFKKMEKQPTEEQSIFIDFLGKELITHLSDKKTKIKSTHELEWYMDWFQTRYPEASKKLKQLLTVPVSHKTVTKKNVTKKNNGGGNCLKLFMETLSLLKKGGNEKACTRQLKLCFNNTGWEEGNLLQAADQILNLLQKNILSTESLLLLMKNLEPFLALLSVEVKKSHSIPQILFNQCIEKFNKTNNQELIDCIEPLLTLFPKNMSSVEPKFLTNFFVVASTRNPSKIFSYYLTFEKYAFFSADTHPEEYQRIYCVVLTVLYAHRNKEILYFLENGEIHLRLDINVVNRHAVFVGLTSLLLGSAQHSLDEKLLPALIKLYQYLTPLSQQFFEENRSPYLPTYYQFQAWADGCLIGEFYKHEDVSNIEQQIKAISESPRSRHPDYQKNCFVFCAPSWENEYAQFLESILSWLDLRNIDWENVHRIHTIDIRTALDNLIKVKTPLRYLRAMQLLFKQMVTLSIKGVEISDSYWTDAYTIIRNLLLMEKSEYHQDIDKFLLWIYNHWEKNGLKTAINRIEGFSPTLAKKMSEEYKGIFRSDFFELQLLYYSQITQCHNLDLFTASLSYTISNISSLRQQKLGPEILENLQKAIVNLCRFDQKEFQHFASEWWKQTEKIYEKTECFDKRVSFILVLGKASIQGGDHANLLIQELEKYFQLLYNKPLVLEELGFLEKNFK